MQLPPPEHRSAESSPELDEPEPEDLGQPSGFDEADTSGSDDEADFDYPILQATDEADFSNKGSQQLRHNNYAVHYHFSLTSAFYVLMRLANISSSLISMLANTKW